MTIDYFATLGQAGGTFPDLKNTEAVTTCYHYLVATDHKKDKKTGADALRDMWGKSCLPEATLPEPETALWQWIATPEIDLTMLPPNSFTVSFTFRLNQPYMSKDDNPFYIIDNPILRDKVFRLPMVRPSSWKGNLRAALRYLGHQDDDTVVHRLFGKVIEMNDDGQSGRLIFYPTFFTRTSLEIINSHDRVRRVGKNPILFESVPSGATGRFTLLYVPYDTVGKEQDDTASEVVADLEVLAKGLRAMFTLYGFGAKTSSGFGMAQETVKDGKLTLRAAGLMAGLPPSPMTKVFSAETLPRYLETPDRLKPEYRNPDGSFRQRSEAELKSLKKADRQIYDKSKIWWEREGKALVEPQSEPQQPAAAMAMAPEWPSRLFGTFDEMVNTAGQVAQQLTTGGRP